MTNRIFVTRISDDTERITINPCIGLDNHPKSSLASIPTKKAAAREAYLSADEEYSGDGSTPTITLMELILRVDGVKLVSTNGSIVEVTHGDPFKYGVRGNTNGIDRTRAGILENISEAICNFMHWDDVSFLDLSQPENKVASKAPGRELVSAS